MDRGCAPGRLSKPRHLASRGEHITEDCEPISSRLLHDCPKACQLYGNCGPKLMSMAVRAALIHLTKLRQIRAFSPEPFLDTTNCTHRRRFLLSFSRLLGMVAFSPQLRRAGYHKHHLF